MSDLKDDLIKIGNENPDLRDNIRTILDSVKEGRHEDMVTVECPSGHRWEVPDDKGTNSDVFDEECPECGLKAKHVV